MRRPDEVGTWAVPRCGCRAQSAGSVRSRKSAARNRRKSAGQPPIANGSRARWLPGLRVVSCPERPRETSDRKSPRRSTSPRARRPEPYPRPEGPARAHDTLRGRPCRERWRAKGPSCLKVDVILGNLEDAEFPARRQGGRPRRLSSPWRATPTSADTGPCGRGFEKKRRLQLPRGSSTDLVEIVSAVGNKSFALIMVQGRGDVGHPLRTSTSCWRSRGRKHGVKKPITRPRHLEDAPEA